MPSRVLRGWGMASLTLRKPAKQGLLSSCLVSLSFRMIELDFPHAPPSSSTRSLVPLCTTLSSSHSNLISLSHRFKFRKPSSLASSISRHASLLPLSSSSITSSFFVVISDFFSSSSSMSKSLHRILVPHGHITSRTTQSFNILKFVYLYLLYLPFPLFRHTQLDCLFIRTRTRT